MKLALIIDKSDAYLRFQRDRVLAEWNVNNLSIETITSITNVGGATLFGGSPTKILSLTDANQVKKFIKDYETMGEEEFRSIFSTGLIIMSNVNRTQTKKLESIMQKNGSLMFIPPSKGNETLAEKLISEIKLQKNIRDFLLDYIGDDYDTILPLIESLSQIPEKYHSKITLEDLYVRLPQPPGSVPPWEIEGPVFSGDVNKAISISRRINQHSSYLVWLALLKKKIVNYYYVNLLAAEGKSDNEITTFLNLPSKGFYYTKKKAKEYDNLTLLKAVNIIINAEAEVKGSSAAPAVAVMDKMLVELCTLFKRK